MPVGKYERTAKHLAILARARQSIVRKPLSDATKAKISASRTKRVRFRCESCGQESTAKPSHFARHKHHFCSTACRGNWVRTLPFHEQNAYRGVRKNGETKQVYHRRNVANNPDTIRHLKARRYARERGAEGSHTLAEWKELKMKFGGRCANCLEEKPLTKDHIIPLSKGGTDYITNIQPLCRNCNSQKWTFIVENPELLEGK